MGSPFFTPPTPPGDPVPPRVDIKPLFPAMQSKVNEGPSSQELERWYQVINDHLNEVGDPELEDVRDEIYRYLR